MANRPRLKVKLETETGNSDKDDIIKAVDRILFDGAAGAANTLVQVASGTEEDEVKREKVQASMYILDRLLGRPKTREQTDDSNGRLDSFLERLVAAREGHDLDT